MKVCAFILLVTLMSGMAEQAPKAPAVAVPHSISFEDLDWTDVGGVLQASVPRSWLDSFVRGEEERNNGTAFARTSNCLRGTAQGVDGPYRKRVFHCQRGPQDCSSMEVRSAAAASMKVKQEAAEGSADGLKPRASLVAKGLSIKVGCRCHFEVREYERQPEVATIRYHEPNHTNHDARFAPYVSAETKLWVILASDGKLSTAEIINQNQNSYLNPILCVRRYCSSVLRTIPLAL